jgi:PKD repeat protein
VTTITGDTPDPSLRGAAVRVTFQVTSGSGTPTGSVTVTVSGEGSTCTGNLSNGSGSCDLTIDNPGNRTLTAAYTGGAGFSPSSDTEEHRVEALEPASTETRITDDDPDPSLSGSPFIVDFEVSSGAGTPTGSVTVTVSGGGPTCSGELSGGAGSCQLALSTAGEVDLIATYSGVAETFAPSTDTEEHMVEAPNQPPTAAFTWECDELECDFEDESSDSDGGIENRLWNFGDGSTSDNSDPDHEYAGGGTYQVSLTVTDNDGAQSSVTQSVTVNAPAPAPATTTTTITSDTPEPSNPGQEVLVSFTVTSDAGTPAGTVTVSDGVDGCTGDLAGGVGSCSLSLNTPGSRTLTATYQGGSNFLGSSDGEPHAVTEPATGVLGLRTQPPSRTESGERLQPEPEVMLLDEGGNSVEIEGITVLAAVAVGSPRSRDRWRVPRIAKAGRSSRS